LIHKDLLCTHSPFFRAALNGSFVEAHLQTIALPSIDPKVFDHVILFLYQNRLEEYAHWFKDDKPKYFELLEVYCVADQLDIEGLRNAVVERVAELAEGTNSVPTPTDTWILYEGVRENSPLRKLVLDLFAFKKTDNLIHTHPDEWHPSFLRDLVVKLKRPASEALNRHDLRAWMAGSWETTKGCEVCRDVLEPGVRNFECGDCKKAVCSTCVGKGVGGMGCDWALEGKECKPWLRGICAYHEHVETERCGE
jgi:hypothetical protein